MKIVGYHAILNQNGQCVIANSDGEVCQQPPYTDFLLQDKSECIKIFYHLNMAVACLCKAFGFSEYQCKKFFEDGQLYYQGWTFKHRGGKFFSLRWGRHGKFVNFSDSAQYEDWRLEPNPTIEQVIHKAKDAQRIGREVYDSLRQLDLHPTSLTSPIRPFAKEVLSKMDIPTHDDIPEGVSEYAYMTCRGGWTEAFQKGHFDKTWDYDLRSCYPFEISKLIDIRPDCGYWKFSKEYIPNAYYGYCKGKITINSPFSPILYNPNDDVAFPDLVSRLEASKSRDRDAPVFTPTGIYPSLRHKKEIEFIKRYGIGDFEFQDGWFFIPKKLTYPLKETVEFLHQHKEQATGRAREVLKRVPQGLYGLTLQIHESDEDPMGEYFNSVYGSEIENPARLEVARFVIENNLVNDVLHIATDGVLATKSAPVTNEPIMGSWKLSSHGSAIVVSSGIAAVQGKELTGEFSLSYDWLLEQIKQNPDASEYSMSKWSPISLGVAILQNKFDKLGQLETLTKTITIPYELKRSYKEKPKTGGDLLKNKYVSVPRDISQIVSMKSIMNNVKS